MKINVTLEVPDDALQSIAERLCRAIRQGFAEIQPKPTLIPGTPPIPKGMIDMRQLAKLLSLSERTVWGMAMDGTMPKPVRFGRCVRWSEEELGNWMLAGCPSAAEWGKIKSTGPASHEGR